MSSKVWGEWQAFSRIEPFGEEREDMRAALVASTMVNMWRDPNKGKPATISDFMFHFMPQEEETTGAPVDLLALEEDEIEQVVTEQRVLATRIKLAMRALGAMSVSQEEADEMDRIRVEEYVAQKSAGTLPRLSETERLPVEGSEYMPKGMI